jgi:hypothetical protein
MFLGIKVCLVHRADNLAAICEPIVYAVYPIGPHSLLQGGGVALQVMLTGWLFNTVTGCYGVVAGSHIMHKLALLWLFNSLLV